MYELRLLPAASRYFKKLKGKPLIEALWDALNQIALDPYAGEEKTGDLSGIYCWSLRYAKTDYRIAYRIWEREGQIVVVVLAGTHENFYDALKRYL